MMSDREKLEAVAKGFNEIHTLRKKQSATQAEMIRACVQHIKSGSSLKRAEGINHLMALAEMLEASGA